MEDGTLLPATCCCLLKEWIEVVDGILPVSSLRLIRLSASLALPLAEAAPTAVDPVFLKLPRRPRGSLRIFRSTASQ